MVIRPKIRGFVCVTAHPHGCAAHVGEQIAYVRRQPRLARAPRCVLVVGASTGYGLASRMVTAFGGRAATLGVYFERTPEAGRLATAGWYNSEAVRREALAEGLWAENLNGDAFSDAVKAEAIARLRQAPAPVDLVVYSLASPRRVHPRTGVAHKSVLKPIGQTYHARNWDTDKNTVHPIAIEPATETEIADTVAVMGGEDWEWWIEALDRAGVLAPDARTVAYSYIGPEQTWPVYKNGTIGRAKDDLERAARALRARLEPRGGGAWISVNKAIVTQASAAIPVVGLYIAILYKIMKQRGLHEGAIEQMQRLFGERLAPDAAGVAVDEVGRIRLDDWEMRPEVQAAVHSVWPVISTETLGQLADTAGYLADFQKLFGFGLAGVDYEADVDV